MPDNPYDRTIIQARERPLSTDINQAQSQLDRALRFYIEQRSQLRSSDLNPLGLAPNGFVSGGFRVRENSPTALQVVVGRGLGYLRDSSDVPTAIGGIVGLDDRSPYKPVLLLGDHIFATPTAPTAPDSRIDIIEARPDRRSENPQSRDIFDAGTGDFVSASVDKTLAFALDGRTGTVTDPAPSTAGLGYKVGIPGNPPTAPSVTAGYTKIAEIFVDSAVATVEANDIADFRKMLFPGGFGRCSAHITYATGVAGAPTLLSGDYHAPPGVDFIIHHSSPSPAVIVLLRAGLIKSWNLMAEAEDGSGGLTRFEVCKMAPQAINTIVEGDSRQLEFADGPNNFPGAVGVAPNQLVGRADVFVIEQVGATTQASTSDPLNMRLFAHFGY